MSSSDISDDMELDDLEQATIQRSPKNRENPFVQIKRDLMRDETISFGCRGMLGYVLTNIDTWIINVKQLWNHAKPHMGRDKVRSLIQEAIDSGYMKRDILKDKNNLNRVIYYISEDREFKKCFRHTENQDVENVRQLRRPEIQGPENPPHKNTIDKIEHKKNIVSQPAVALTTLFFDTLRQINPKVREPNRDQWSIEMDRMLKIDGRTESEITEVIKYILYQHQNPKREFTWSKAISSVKKLRQHFATVWLESTTKTPEQQKQQIVNSEVALIKNNRSWIRQFEEKITNRLPSHMRFMVSEDRVAFSSKDFYQPVVYSDPGFQSVIEHYCRKFQ